MTIGNVTNNHSPSILCSFASHGVLQPAKKLMDLLRRTARPVVCFRGCKTEEQVYKRPDVYLVAVVQQRLELLCNFTGNQQTLIFGLEQLDERFQVIILFTTPLGHAVAPFM